MKKLFVLLILMMSVLILKAGGESTSYVKVGDKTYFCQKVKPGLLNMNLMMDNGKVMKVPIKKVDSYSCNGRMFERLPIMCKGTPNGCTALMELVTFRNGFRLYKHSECRESGDMLEDTYEKTHLQVEYYVYKDGKFYLPVTNENAESILGFFGIKVKWS